MDLKEKLGEQSSKSKAFGKDQAIAAFSQASGMPAGNVHEFYDSILKILPTPMFVANAPIESVMAFLGGANLPSKLENEEQTLVKAIGCMEHPPFFGVLTHKKDGNRKKGSCSIVFARTPDVCMAICGSPARMWDIGRKDFVDDPMSIVYSIDDVKDCQVSKALMTMDLTSKVASPAVALDAILSDGSLTECIGLAFGTLSPEMVSMIVVDSEKNQSDIRQVLESMGKMLPVEIVERDPAQSSVDLNEEEKLISKKDSCSRYFEKGDHVIQKIDRSTKGVISFVGDGRISVQWSDSSISDMDVTEAMMRLMWDVTPMDGPKIDYELAGMDDETRHFFESIGFDPVRIHSIIMHFMPATKSANGWIPQLINAMNAIGISCREEHGFKAVHGKKPFVKASWIEAPIPNGGRFVMDIRHNGVVIKAGDVDEYIPCSTIPQEE